MKDIGHMPAVRFGAPRGWLFYLIDLCVAVGGPLLITAFIAYSRLYPRITCITMVYLLLIIGLAVLRSRYPATLATVITILSIDFFLTAPFYSFTFTHPDDLISLAIFFVVAMMTSFLAGLARRQAYDSTEREYRLRQLNELLRICNLTDDLPVKLDNIALTTNRIFSDWGMQECAIFLPDEHGELQVRAEAPIDVDEFTLTSCKRSAGDSVLSTGTLATLREEGSNPQSIAYMLPLRVRSERPLGVLYLRAVNDSPWIDDERHMQQALDRQSPEGRFFWSYLDQISQLVERALFHQQLATS